MSEGPLQDIDRFGKDIARAWLDGFGGRFKPKADTAKAQRTDPAPHVARAYHYERDGLCSSDSKPWPCPTAEEYGLDEDPKED